MSSIAASIYNEYRASKEYYPDMRPTMWLEEFSIDMSDDAPAWEWSPEMINTAMAFFTRLERVFHEDRFPYRVGSVRLAYPGFLNKKRTIFDPRATNCGRVKV